MKFLLEGWDVSPETNGAILVLIRITIRIHEFLAEFLPLPGIDNAVQNSHQRVRILYGVVHSPQW